MYRLLGWIYYIFLPNFFFLSIFFLLIVLRHTGTPRILNCVKFTIFPSFFPPSLFTCSHCVFFAIPFSPIPVLICANAIHLGCIWVYRVICALIWLLYSSMIRIYTDYKEIRKKKKWRNEIHELFVHGPFLLFSIMKFYEQTDRFNVVELYLV